jgi:flagellar export protein FliJ
MARFTYRLQRLLDVKIERKEQLERNLVQCQRELVAEQEALDELRRAQARIEEKLTVSKRSILGGSAGVSEHVIRQRTDYLHGLASDLEAAKNAEFSQRLRVREFEERLAEARHLLAEGSREVEVLNKHRDRLEKRFLKELEKQEAAEQDEIATSMFNQGRRAHESFR